MLDKKRYNEKKKSHIGWWCLQTLSRRRRVNRQALSNCWTDLYITLCQTSPQIPTITIIYQFLNNLEAKQKSNQRDEHDARNHEGRGKDVSTIKGEYGIREEEEASLPLPSSSNIAQLLLFFAAPIFFKIFSSLKILFSDLNLLILFSPQFFFVRRLFYFQ